MRKLNFVLFMFIFAVVINSLVHATTYSAFTDDEKSWLHELVRISHLQWNRDQKTQLRSAKLRTQRTRAMRRLSKGLVASGETAISDPARITTFTVTRDGSNEATQIVIDAQTYSGFTANERSWLTPLVDRAETAFNDHGASATLEGTRRTNRTRNLRNLNRALQASGRSAFPSTPANVTTFVVVWGSDGTVNSIQVE